MLSITLDTTKIHFDNGVKYYGNQDYNGLQYCPEKKHFFCDIHACNGQPSQLLLIKNSQTKNTMLFSRVKIDYDGSNEDIYGWQYECIRKGEKYTLLIVNS